jgi:hypothetical protein
MSDDVGSRFWIIWASPQAPVSRYPAVRFIHNGAMHTVRVYEAFRRNEFFMDGDAFVYPIVLPKAAYSVQVSTEPTYSRRVLIYSWEGVESATIRFDLSAGRSGQLAVGLVPIGGPAGAAGVGGAVGTVEAVSFADVVPRTVERPLSAVRAQPDLERAQNNRGLRQLLRNGMVPYGSAEGAQWSGPEAIPHGVATDHMGMPLGCETNSWNRWA